MIVAALLLVALQTSAAPAPAAPATAAATARLNLDTPVEAIVADPKGKAVLDADIPELTPNELYESFKTMSLHQLQTYRPERLTEALLAKVAADLAAIK